MVLPIAQSFEIIKSNNKSVQLKLKTFFWSMVFKKRKHTNFCILRHGKISKVIQNINPTILN